MTASDSGLGQDSLTRHAPVDGYLYMARGRPLALTPRKDRIYFATELTDELSVEAVKGGDEEVTRFKTAGGRLWVVVKTPVEKVEDIGAASNGYRSLPKVVSSGAVFDLGDGETDLVLTDEIVIQTRGGLAKEEIAALLAEYGLTEILEYPPSSGRILVRTSAETLDAALELYADERIEYASPNLYYEGKPQAVGCPFPVQGWGGAIDCDPSNPPSGYDDLADTQWQWDVACVWQAWQVPLTNPRGSSSVLVYHNDYEGFNPEHPDVRPNVKDAVSFANPDYTWETRANVTFQATHSETAVYLFHRTGIGESIIDKVSLTVEGQSTELIPNGDFEAGQGNWEFLGVYNQSQVVTDADPQHNKVLKLVSTAKLFGGSTVDASNVVKLTIPNLSVGTTYRLKVDTKNGSITVRSFIKLGKPTEFSFKPPNFEGYVFGFPRHLHGTAIAGIMVGADNNPGDMPGDDNIGIMGVAPDCELLYAQGFQNLSNGTVASFYDVSSLYWAGNSGARVVNYSWLIYTETDDFLRALQRLAGEGSHGRGAVITVAAGNFNFPIPKYYIGAHPLAVAVSASRVTEVPGGTLTETKDCGGLNGFAYGPDLDLLAPNTKMTLGGEVLTWTTASFEPGQPDQLYRCLTNSNSQGTSFCAPFVGGIAALMISQDSGLYREDVSQILFHTASTDLILSPGCADQPIDPVTGRSDHFGHGRVDAKAAVEHAVRGTRWPAPVPDFHVEPERYLFKTAHRLHWSQPERNFSGVVVFKSMVGGQRLLFRPVDSQGTGPGLAEDDPVAGGKVLWVSAGTGAATTCLDEENEPASGSVRYYTIFAYNESNETVNGQQQTWRRWSFGREVKLRKGSLRTVSATLSLSTVLQNYTLLGGDLISVVDGSYPLSAPVVWGAGDQGSDADGDVFLSGRSVPTETGGAIFTPQTGFSGTAALRISARRVTVKNLSFKSFSSAGTAAIEVLPSADQVRLVANRISGSAVGMRLGQAGGTGHTGPVLVQNNVILNTGTGIVPGAIGIHCPKKPTLFSGGFGGFYTIVNNTLVMVDATGVQLDFAPFVCSSCSSGGDLPGGHTVELYNNILKCDASAGSCALAASACIRTQGFVASNHNNLLGPVIGYVGSQRICPDASDSLQPWRAQLFADKDSIRTDSGFVAPSSGDYSLSNHSECVNRGELYGLLSQELYPLDYSTAGPSPQRLRAGRVDIGADEVDAPDLGKQFIRGDANEDGAVDLSDSVYLLNYLHTGGPPPVCPDAADANDDEALDTSDAIYINSFIFLGPTGDLKWLPPPYPGCGVDPFGFTVFCSQNRPAPPCPP